MVPHDLPTRRSAAPFSYPSMEAAADAAAAEAAVDRANAGMAGARVMAVTRRRNLTAQEVLDMDGYIVYLSDNDYSIGSVVENHRGTKVPTGTKLVVIGTLTRKEGLAQARRAGWSTRNWEYYDKFYKVVVE